MSFGYTQSHSDYISFFKATTSSYTCLLIYVGDLIIVGDYEEHIFSPSRHTSMLNFTLRTQVHSSIFLEFRFSNLPQASLSQRKCALDILQDFAQLVASLSMIPISHNHNIFPGDDLLQGPSSYRKLISKLLYLPITRSNISYAVSHHSQFFASPTQSHFQSGIKLLKYIKNALGKGILYRRVAFLQLHAYHDAHWADFSISKNPLQFSQFSWVVQPSHENRKNKQLSLGHLLRVNIGQWIQHFLKSCGCITS